ncbi:ABC transporter substrate-binding protein [Roseiflexus castenholzii]|uniref:ABC transporter substrate-binding protein n=1 Tax=Roseiflexus castenholzii TaxID=120962 RepID=UPI003C7D0D4A
MVHRLSILVILLALLAACGGQPATGAPTNMPAATNISAATSVPAPTTAPTSVPADSAAFRDTITHDRGTITLERPAERIVVFSEEFTEIMIALDLAPVGVALWRNEPTGDTFTQLPYLDQPIPGQPRYIDGNTPNLEVIAALRPDLIVYHDYGGEAGDTLYASLGQIAPTVAYSGGEVGGWKRAIQGIAQAADRVPQAEQIIAAYDARVTALTAEMAPIVQQAPVVTLLLSGIDFVGVFDARFAIGGLMQTLGFRLAVPEGTVMDESGYAAISAEILSAIEADSVVTMRFEAEKAHLADPILSTLNVPILTTEIYEGMGYTGPFAEVIHLEGFAQAFRDHYLVAASTPATTRTVTDDLGRTVTIPANP